MRRRLSLLAAIALLALPAVVAFARGGYFDAARLRAGIAACLLAAVAAAVAARPLPSTAAGRVAIGGLAALIGWSALSLTWAPLAGPAVDDVERLVALPRRADRRGGAADRAGGTLDRARPAGRDRRSPPPTGSQSGCCRALFELDALAGGGRPARAAADVLERPGRARARVGLVLAARARRGARDRPLRAPPRAASRSSGSTSTSRSRAAPSARWPPACSCCSRSTGTRAALFAALLVAAGAAPPGACSPSSSLSDVMRADSPAGAGAAMLVVLVAAGAACAFGALRLPRGAVARRCCARSRSPRSSPRWSSPSRRSRRSLEHADHRLGAARLGRRATATTTGASRSTRSPTTRSRASAPAASASSGCCGATIDESVRDAHSLYLETAAELGLVGLAALLALFGGVVVAARRARTPAAAAALAAWAVHAGVDWDWELPGAHTRGCSAGRSGDRGGGAGSAAAEPVATDASPPAAAAAPASTSSPPPAPS